MYHVNHPIFINPIVLKFIKQFVILLQVIGPKFDKIKHAFNINYLDRIFICVYSRVHSRLSRQSRLDTDC